MTGSRRPSPLGVAVAVTVIVLLATAEERLLGTVTDEQVLAATSVSIAEFGEIGILRGQTIGVGRPGGDAVAPYGLAWPALLAPLMALGGPFERLFGSGTSQSLLILLPIGLVAAASAGAGLLARAAGAAPSGQVMAVLATGIGSPLWAYASTLFTEPLQAALLVFAVLHSARGRPFAAGLLAGCAVLAKSVNVAVLPLTLLPLAWPRPAAGAPSPRVSLLRAGAGAVLPIGAWVAFDVARFGAPLRGYVGQRFSHPPIDGLWRLTVGLNEGLLVFFPMLVLSVAGLILLAGRSAARGIAVSIGGTSAVLLALYSAWWAWDGSSGWGPRLLVPIIPLLAAAAGVAACLPRLPRTLAPSLLGLGIAVNSLGVLQADTATIYYVDSCGPVIVPEEQVPWYPDGLAASAPPGQRRISRTMAVARDAAYSALRVHPWLVAERLRGGVFDGAEGGDSPWSAHRPEARPRRFRGTEGEISGHLHAYLDDVLRWPHWGAVVRASPAERRRAFHGAWQDAALDQVLRALDTGRPDRAARLAREIWNISGNPLAAALLAEAMREQGRREELGAFLRALPADMPTTSDMWIVLALIARDQGQEHSARGALRNAAGPGSTLAVRAAVEAPMSEWPATYRELTR